MSTTHLRHAAPHSVEGAVRRNPFLVMLGRTGWVAKGVVYGILGFLAFVVARNGGTSTDEASPRGAVGKVAESTAGTALLWVLAIGLILYVLWRLVCAVLPGDDDAEGALTRVGYVVSAIVYGALAWTAISFARSGGGQSQSAGSDDSRVSKLTSDLMGHTGGRFLVGVIGVVFLVIGGVFVYQAVTRKFEERDLEPGGVGPVSHEALVKLGIVGYLARAVIMALIGVFLLRAAIDYDAEQASGLDDALRRTAGSSWGAALVAITGIGLIVYGLYAALSAPRERLAGPH
jgi:hypothetical protein